MTVSEKELRYIELGRMKARTDLLWLARHVLGMRKIVPHVHGPMARMLQQFPRNIGVDEWAGERFEYRPYSPDPVGVLEGERRKLLLAPRGWYKTSLNVIAHSIQWILNYPDITILLVHASQEMAEQILVNIKHQFQNNNVMRYFFPEFCPAAKTREWGTQQFFNSPARRNWTTAPTMQVSGIETIRTGMHYHVIKFTDIVDDKNSSTQDQCEKVIYRYGMARNLLISPLYWMDIEGTRYNFSDLYGRIIDEWLKEQEEGREHKFKVFVMGCYKKDVGREEMFTPDELEAPYLLDGEGRKVSHFPEEFPVEKLEEMRTDPVTGEDTFNTQQLNNPINSESQVFSPKDMRWKTPEEISRVPVQFYVTTVDLAETTGKKSDFTVITTCAVDRMNRRTVVDIRLAKMLPDKVVDELFNVVLRWRPYKVKVEETGFLRGLLPTIRRKSEMTGIWPNWVFITRDTQVAKTERIMSLQPWYKGGLLYFSTELPDYVKEHLKHELSRFPKYKYDDILDTLADQFQGETVFGPLKESKSEKEMLQYAQKVMLERLDVYESVFGKKKPLESWTGLGAL